MSASTEPLIVTDDEIVALTLDGPHPWQRPMATVDTASHEAVAAAVVRGVRSLSLRGIVDDPEELSSMVSLLRHLAAESPVAMIVRLTRAMEPVEGVERGEYYQDGEACIVVSSDAIGAHRIFTMDTAAALTSLADAVVESRNSDVAGDTVVFIGRGPATILRCGSDPARLTAVDGGRQWSAEPLQAAPKDAPGWFTVFASHWPHPTT